jgi:hypothetical protein
VLSRYGFHLIEITSRHGDSVGGRHVLIPIEVAGAHRDALDAQADTLERLAVEHTSPAALDSAARALRLTIRRAEPVAEGSRTRVGNVVVPDAGTWAFEAKPGSNSSLIETAWAYYVFRLDSVKQGGVPPLADAREAAAAAARNAKKLAAARKLGEVYIRQLAQGASMESAAKAMDFPYREFGPFTRVAPPLSSPVIVGAAFGLAAGERSGLLETGEGFYVIQVLERTKADSAEFTTKLADIRAQAIYQARQERARAYLEALRESAKVVDRRSEVLQQQQASGA